MRPSSSTELLASDSPETLRGRQGSKYLRHPSCSHNPLSSSPIYPSISSLLLLPYLLLDPYSLSHYYLTARLAPNPTTCSGASRSVYLPK